MLFGPAGLYNAPTLASIDTRQITQMSDISIFLMNFLELRKGEVHRIYLLQGRVNRVLGAAQGRSSELRGARLVLKVLCVVYASSWGK